MKFFKHPLFLLIGAWSVLGVVLSIVLYNLPSTFLMKFHITDENILSTAWAIPDFLILVTILWWLMFKNTPAALPMLDMKARLRNRRNKVAEALDGAEKALDEADSQHNDYSGRLEKIEQEIAGLKDLIRKEGETEREKILEEAKRQVERIKNEAEFTAKQELKMAQARLKQEAVDRAVELAEEILTRTMNDDDRTRLLDEFLEKMEKTA